MPRTPAAKRTRPIITPDKTTLRRYLEQGMTHDEIRIEWERVSGHRVTRQGIAAAAVRHGLAGTKPRYPEHVPWRLKEEHTRAYPARMLRLLGRRDTGGSLNDKEAKLLDSWLASMAENDLIVAYDPDDEQGLHYVDSSFKDHDDPIPVLRRRIRLG